jgi:uncharacterized membrane protein (UPF0127 family)
MRRALFVCDNETQDEQLIGRLRLADTFITRLRGLTFRRRLGADEGLLLVGRTETRAEAAIHMFFVFFPIGVIWLDREHRVVDMVVARPFRPYYAPSAPALSVLECRPEILDKVEVGDKIRLTPHDEISES